VIALLFVVEVGSLVLSVDGLCRTVVEPVCWMVAVVFVIGLCTVQSNLSVF
jgi:hypothetical protein